MFESVFASLNLKLSQGVIVAIVIAVLIALTVFGVWLTTHEISGWIESAAATARAERDAHWQGEIDKSNAIVERARADQAIKAAALESDASAKVDALTQSLSQLEAANAALPNADRCGLGRARIRLLR